jgi:hypothetical protein
MATYCLGPYKVHHLPLGFSLHICNNILSPVRGGVVFSIYSWTLVVLCPGERDGLEIRLKKGKPQMRAESLYPLHRHRAEHIQGRPGRVSDNQYDCKVRYLG